MPQFVEENNSSGSNILVAPGAFVSSLTIVVRQRFIRHKGQILITKESCINDGKTFWCASHSKTKNDQEAARPCI